jgi:hypothetical protein
VAAFRHQVHAGLPEGLAEIGGRQEVPAAGVNGCIPVHKVLFINGASKALKLHRLSGKDGQPRRLLAGKGEGQLPQAGEVLDLPPGVDGAGVAKGLGPQLADNAAAAVLVLEAALPLRRVAHHRIEGVGGVLALFLQHRGTGLPESGVPHLPVH